MRRGKAWWNETLDDVRLWQKQKSTPAEYHFACPCHSEQLLASRHAVSARYGTQWRFMVRHDASSPF